MKENSLVLRGYIGYAFLYLLSAFLGLDTLVWFMKPLLMPFLIFAVYRAEYFSLKKILLAALTFSWFGDIVLLFADRSEIYFIVGLLLFLISHIFYIELFYKYKSSEQPLRKPLFWLAIGLVLWYLKSMLEYLLPKLGELQSAVTVYAITISAMLIMAFKLYFGTKRSGKYLVIAGAVFFVVSDSLLAVNKFLEPLQYANLLIMATYLIAQYFLTAGTLRLHRRKKN